MKVKLIVALSLSISLPLCSSWQPLTAERERKRVKQTAEILTQTQTPACLPLPPPLTTCLGGLHRLPRQLALYLSSSMASKGKKPASSSLSWKTVSSPNPYPSQSRSGREGEREREWGGGITWKQLVDSAVLVCVNYGEREREGKQQNKKSKQRERNDSLEADSVSVFAFLSNVMQIPLRNVPVWPSPGVTASQKDDTPPCSGSSSFPVTNKEVETVISCIHLIHHIWEFSSLALYGR